MDSGMERLERRNPAQRPKKKNKIAGSSSVLNRVASMESLRRAVTKGLSGGKSLLKIDNDEPYYQYN
jgi:hypothetical protein